MIKSPLDGAFAFLFFVCLSILLRNIKDEKNILLQAFFFRIEFSRVQNASAANSSLTFGIKVAFCHQLSKVQSAAAEYVTTTENCLICLPLFLNHEIDTEGGNWLIFLLVTNKSTASIHFSRMGTSHYTQNWIDNNVTSFWNTKTWPPSSPVSNHSDLLV